MLYVISKVFFDNVKESIIEKLNNFFTCLDLQHPRDSFNRAELINIYKKHLASKSKINENELNLFLGDIFIGTQDFDTTFFLTTYYLFILDNFEFAIALKNDSAFDTFDIFKIEFEKKLKTSTFSNRKILCYNKEDVYYYEGLFSQISMLYKLTNASNILANQNKFSQIVEKCFIATEQIVIAENGKVNNQNKSVLFFLDELNVLIINYNSLLFSENEIRTFIEDHKSDFYSSNFEKITAEGFFVDKFEYSKVGNYFKFTISIAGVSIFKDLMHSNNVLYCINSAETYSLTYGSFVYEIQYVETYTSFNL